MRPLHDLLTGFACAVLATCLTAVAAGADDIPLPVKKPRDKTGADISAPERASPTPNIKDAKPDKGAAASKDAEAATKVKVSAPSTTAPMAAQTSPATAPETAGKEQSSKAAAPAATSATTPAPVPKEWLASDIEAAKAHCVSALKGVDAVTVPEPPFREGECGAPAAVHLISIGRDPQVSLSPPAILTCDMVAALHTWLKDTVQPLAKKHLGAKVITIETMSGYACRMAYGRKAAKLSEHGHANALDIRGFVTANAQTANVLEHWGPIERVRLAQVAAAKAAAEKAAAEQAKLSKTGADKAMGVVPNASDSKAVRAQVTTQSPGAAPPAQASGGSSVDTMPTLKGAKDIPEAASGLGLQPAHLGGPKDKQKGKGKSAPDVAAQTPPAAPSPNPQGTPGVALTKTALFLRGVHAAACNIFGTTLGPEANDDHRNHFHIDMAPRKTKRICD